MSTPEVQPVPETLPRLSEPERIINTFVAPTKTFQDLKAKASWASIVIAYLLISASTLLFIYSVQVKIGWDNVAENRMRRMPKIEKLMERAPVEQRQKYYADAPRNAQSGAFWQPAVMAIILLIFAAVLMASVNFGLGGRVGYKQSIAIVVFASLPWIIRSLVATAVIFGGVDPGGFNFDSPIASNLGSFFDPAQHSFLYTFGSFIDLFAIWTLLLESLGFSIVAGARFKSCVIVVFGWYLLLGLVFASLFAAFLG